MTKQSPAISILITLYRAASRGRILTEMGLSDLTGLDSRQLTTQLCQLDRGGYVSAGELRLTLAGLAVAVAASAKTKGSTLARAA